MKRRLLSLVWSSPESSLNHEGRYAANTKITKILLPFVVFVSAVRPSWLKVHPIGIGFAAFAMLCIVKENFEEHRTFAK